MKMEFLPTFKEVFSLMKRKLMRDGAVAVPSSTLRLENLRGIVAPISNKTQTVTLRLSGVWYDLWQELRADVPGVSEAELLRQGLALRIAMSAIDASGKLVRTSISFRDSSGNEVTQDLGEYVGIPK